MEKWLQKFREEGSARKRSKMRKKACTNAPICRAFNDVPPKRIRKING
jgi:hypothetical protein